MLTTNANEQQAMYPGSITMKEYVFAQAAPVLLETLVLILERYPDLDIEIQQLMILARANVVDKQQGLVEKAGHC